jgi:hypothetical protein
LPQFLHFNNAQTHFFNNKFTIKYQNWELFLVDGWQAILPDSGINPIYRYFTWPDFV